MLFMRGSRNFRQGGPGQSDKKSSDNVFFFLVLSLFYRSQMVNFKEIYHFSRFQGGGGGPTFSRGVGSNLLIPYRNPYNLWFSRVVRTPCPPLWIRTCYFVVCRFFRNEFFRKIIFRNTIRVSNCLNPDQARHSVGPDLGPNCLQRLSADKLVGKRVELMMLLGKRLLYDLYHLACSIRSISA